MRFFIVALVCSYLNYVTAIANASSSSTTLHPTTSSTSSSSETSSASPTILSSTLLHNITTSSTTKTSLPSTATTTTTTTTTTTEKPKSTSLTNKPLVVKKVPNPEVGLRVVIIFLAVVAFLGAIFLTYLFVKKHRQRLQYQQPNTLRTEPSENSQFENPIHFPAATYGDAVI